MNDFAMLKFEILHHYCENDKLMKINIPLTYRQLYVQCRSKI